jgi:cation:H+ antiporter
VTLILFVLGLALLVAGADLLVKGAARIAAVAGIAPLVIGLTVVAFGTSAPELAVTVAATARGEPDIALGNVVGSNITNVLLILGLSALVSPLVVRRRLVRLDVPILILATVAVLIVASDGVIGRGQGGALLAAGVAYVVLVVLHARHAGPGDAIAPLPPLAPRPRRRRVALDIGHILGGLVLLVLGSRWLVDAARTIADALGVSQLAIGLTVVAIGTSLPELATSVVAGIRGQADIAVGNILGSNLFNLLIVLGAGAAVSPAGIAAHPTAVAFDIPVMLVVTVACLPVFYSGRTVSRWEGALFVACFVGYTSYVLLAAAGQAPPPTLRAALLFFAVPLTTLALLIAILRARR